MCVPLWQLPASRFIHLPFYGGLPPRNARRRAGTRERERERLAEVSGAVRAPPEGQFVSECTPYLRSTPSELTLHKSQVQIESQKFPIASLKSFLQLMALQKRTLTNRVGVTHPYSCIPNGWAVRTPAASSADLGETKVIKTRHYCHTYLSMLISLRLRFPCNFPR